jgi:perosamine synthetase
VTIAVKSGWVSSIGEYVDKFEKKFAEYIQVKHALAVCNGTAALHLALAALGVSRGDEVIVPDLTFVATANAVAYTGATPVLVDVSKESWCIDPEAISKAITDKTKAIIPVHLYGHPADMDTINEIAKKNGLYVIEDAAEAHGAEYKGRRVGSLGICGAFSFYGNKIITTGEGGMITSNDEDFYERAKYLRDHAMSKNRRYWHTEIGYNYRLTNIQAALGLAQLERIDDLLNKKRQIFEWYSEFLGPLDGVKLNPEMPWAKNVFWMVCLVLGDSTGVSRDDVMSKLAEKGIDTRPFFYPLSQMPMYNNGKVNSVAYNLANNGLNLPSGSNLTEKEVKWIAENVKKTIDNT